MIPVFQICSFANIVYVDGNWCVSNPLTDIEVSINQPTSLVFECISLLETFTQKPKTRQEILTYLAQHRVVLNFEEDIFLYLVKSTILSEPTSIGVQDSWMNESYHYEIIRYLKYRSSAKFVDYNNDDVYKNDQLLMKNYERNDKQPSIYKQYPLNQLYFKLPHPSVIAPNNIINRLSYVLFWGFGRLLEVNFHHMLALLKVVPSMGARHPFEAYIISSGNKFAKGIFHYSVKDNALYKLRPETIKNTEIDCLLLITLVVDRFQWRYRHSWNYKDVFYDLGHLTMTLKVVIKELSMQLVPVKFEENSLGLEYLKEEIVCSFALENI